MQIAAFHMVHTTGHILGQETCTMQYHILLSMYVPQAPSVSILADRSALMQHSITKALELSLECHLACLQTLVSTWGHAGLGLGLGGWQRFLSAHAISALPCLAVGHVACSLVTPVSFYRSPLKIFIRLSPPCSAYLGSSTCSMAKSSERSRSSVTSSAHILSGIGVVHCFVHKLSHFSAVGILMSKCNLHS